MPRVDPLFNLIQFLTASEKRRFRLRSSRYEQEEGHNYLKLFDLLEGSKRYSKAVINVKFKGEPFLKNLSVAKHFLRRAILESLQEPKKKIEPSLIANTLFEDAKILESKGLLYDAARAYRKSATLAGKRWDEVLRHSALASLSRILPMLKEETQLQK